MAFLLRALGVVLIGLCFQTTSLAAPIYTVTGGELTEISGIEISGLGIWNATFRDGTFNSIFGGTSAGLDFTNLTDAQKATAALQGVLVGDAGQPGWDLDLEPYRVFGCEVGLINGCSPLTPYAIVFNSYVGDFVVNNSLFDNLAAVTDVSPYSNQTLLTSDTSSRTDLVYVDWTFVSAAVPEPPTALILISGLWLIRVRKRHKTASK